MKYTQILKKTGKHSDGETCAHANSHVHTTNNPNTPIHIHNVRVEDMAAVIEWASEAFYAQCVEVMF